MQTGWRLIWRGFVAFFRTKASQPAHSRTGNTCRYRLSCSRVASSRAHTRHSHRSNHRPGPVDLGRWAVGSGQIGAERGIIHHHSSFIILVLIPTAYCPLPTPFFYCLPPHSPLPFVPSPSNVALTPRVISATLPLNAVTQVTPFSTASSTLYDPGRHTRISSVP